MRLTDYVLVFDGQFINTRFDYLFKMTCDFKDPEEVSSVDFKLFSVKNNFSQEIPQIQIQNIVIPLNEDNCELETQGGLVSALVEQYIEAFKLDDTLQAVMSNLNNVVALDLSNNINARLQNFFKPYNMTLQL